MVKKRHYKRYRDKQCPKCGKIHKSQGVFCSKPCSNSYRTISDSHRKNQSIAIREYYKRPEYSAHKQQLINRNSGKSYQKVTEMDISIPAIMSELLDIM